MGNYFQNFADELNKKSNKVNYRSNNTTSTPQPLLKPISQPIVKPIAKPTTISVANKQRKALNSFSMYDPVSNVQLPPVKRNIFQTMFNDPSNDAQFTRAKPTSKEIAYNKFKVENPDTPNILKPLAYTLDTPWRIPATQRLLTKTSNFLGINPINGQGKKIEAMSTGNKLIDGGIDVGGMIIGSGFTGGKGQNLLTGTDKLAQYGGGKIASTVSKLGGNRAIANSIGNGLGTYGRGAIDAGATTAIEGFSKGRELKTIAKDTAINSVFGGGMFLGGKLIGDTVSRFTRKPIQSALQQTDAITPKNNILQPQGLKGSFKRPQIETPTLTPKLETPQIRPLNILNANGKLKPQVVNMKSDTLPLAQRTLENVGDKKVNAYTYDNPTLHSYVADEAKIIKGEIARGSKPVNGGINNVKIPGGSNDAIETIGYGNIPSVRSETTAELSKATGASYAKIDKALDDIIVDHGRENNALAKRVELAIDDRLSNGYREDVLGHDIPAHSEYLQEKAFINGMPDNMNTSTFNKPQLTSKLKPTSNIKVESANIPINNKLLPTGTIQGQNIPTTSEVTQTLKGKSRFANVTLEESSNSAKQFKKDLKELDLGYDEVTNANSLKQANARIDTDVEKAVQYVMNNKEVGSAEHTTTAIQLINKFQKEGNYERAIDVASNISSKLTKNGQAIQAASIYDRLSPEGILLYAQRQVTKLNDNRWFKGLTKEQKINPELAKQLQELSTNMKNLTGDAKTEASQELQQALQALGKSTLGRKAESAQTIMQLLNPKTMGRNVISNELFYRVERINKYMATPIDMVRSSITGGERTVTFKTGGQGGYWKGWLQGTKAGWKGVNPGGLQTQYDLTAPAFSGKWNPMTYLEKTLGATLKGFDYAAYTRAVNQTVGEMGELAAINSKLLGSARKAHVQEFVKTANKNVLDMADQYGKYVTFQDNNVLSKGLSAVKKGMNLGKDFGAGSFIIKYPKTPGALIMRSLDYSVAGFLKSAYEVAKPLMTGKPINTREATMALSRGITGTLGFTGLGYMLADKGVITGRTNKDKDVRELQKDAGGGSYKVNLSALQRWATGGFNMSDLDLRDEDTMYSYDWLAPISMAVSFGANINSNIKENKGTLNSTVATLASGMESSLNTVAEQPVLQGLTKQFQGYDLGQNVTNTLKGIPSSFTPTLLNQIKQVKDNTSRNTYDINPAKEALNKAQNKIPGKASKLPVAYTTSGKVKQTYQNNSNTLLNIFGNPGFVSKNTPTAVQKEVLRLYDTTSEKTHFPSVAPKFINATQDNPRVNLTGAEMSEYQKLMGEKTTDAYLYTIGTSVYKQLQTDIERVGLLNKDMAKAKEEAKIEMLKKLNKYNGKE